MKKHTTPTAVFTMAGITHPTKRTDKEFEHVLGCIKIDYPQATGYLISQAYLPNVGWQDVPNGLSHVALHRFSACTATRVNLHVWMGGDDSADPDYSTDELDLVPDDCAHVALTEKYTATVHPLSSLVAYLGMEGSVDLKHLCVKRWYGNKADDQSNRNQSLGDFVRNLRKKMLGDYAEFNDGPHHCVDLGPVIDETKTITTKYGDERITFSFIAQDKSGGGLECVDILRHSGPKDSDGRSVMQSVMFHGGQGSSRAQGTLLTLLTNKAHEQPAEEADRTQARQSVNFLRGILRRGAASADVREAVETIAAELGLVR